MRTTCREGSFLWVDDSDSAEEAADAEKRFGSWERRVGVTYTNSSSSSAGCFGEDRAAGDRHRFFAAEVFRYGGDKEEEEEVGVAAPPPLPSLGCRGARCGFPLPTGGDGGVLRSSSSSSSRFASWGWEADRRSSGKRWCSRTDKMVSRGR